MHHNQRSDIASSQADWQALIDGSDRASHFVLTSPLDGRFPNTTQGSNLKVFNHLLHLGNLVNKLIRAAAITVFATCTLAATSTVSTAAPIRDLQQIEPYSAADCLHYLDLAGYQLTVARANACESGESDGTGQLNCFLGLINTGVTDYHASNACELAND
jgi:hypothetical protein